MYLPNHLSDKAAGFPEYGYGANKVTLFLKDNRKIKNVILAWGKEIIKIGGRPLNKIQNIGFSSDEIIDVQHEG